MELVTVVDWKGQKARLEAHGVDDQGVAFPASDGMAGASEFEVLRMLLQVHVDRAFQAELSIFEDDRVFALGNSIDGTVEVPIKDDAGGFAPEARVLLFPRFGVGVRSRFLANVCQRC